MYRKFKIATLRGTVFFNRDADELLSHVHFVFDKYVINFELQHTYDFKFCIALFSVCFVVDKIRIFNLALTNRQTQRVINRLDPLTYLWFTSPPPPPPRLQFKSLLKTMHLLVKKHRDQYFILASLILVVCNRNSDIHVSTIQLRLFNEHHADFESYFISVTNLRLVCLLPVGAILYPELSFPLRSIYLCQSSFYKIFVKFGNSK